MLGQDFHTVNFFCFFFSLLVLSQSLPKSFVTPMKCLNLKTMPGDSREIASNQMHGHDFIDFTLLCCRPDACKIVSREDGSIGTTLGLHFLYPVRSVSFNLK